MAMFFDFPVQSDATPGNIAWHPKYPLLAMAGSEVRQGVESGCVQIFTDDGEKIEGATVQRVSQITSVAWHPEHRFLTIGYENGEVLVWNHNTLTAHECRRQHDGAVNFLSWSQTGSRLVSGDEEGRIAVWKPQKSGKLTLVKEYQRQGEMSHCVITPGGDEGDSDSYSTDGPRFFVGTVQGTVYEADCVGRCEVAFTVPGVIRAMLYNNDTDILIALTNDLTMTQHRVADDGTLTDKREMKLAGRGAMDFAWAGAGLLASAVNENSVRMWDLIDDNHYVLSLANEQGDFSTSDQLQCVAFDPRQGLLTAGSSNGFVYMWRLKSVVGVTGPALEAEHKWQFQTPSEVSGAVVRLSFGGGKSLLASQSESTVSVLREHVTRKGFHKGVGVIQVSSTRLVVDCFQKASHDFETEFAIKGVSVGNNAVTVWSGKEVEVRELVKEQTILRPAGKFVCPATSVAMRDQVVFTAEGNTIHVRSFQGASVTAVKLSDSEGEAIALATNGNYLAAATSEGYVRVWDLSKRDPKEHGAPKRVGDDLDLIHSIAVNCNGTRVAILGSVHDVPDSSVWVWDVETDQMQTYSFGTGGRVPTGIFWDSLEPKLLVCEGRSFQGEKIVPLVVSIFSTPDDGLHVQERFENNDEYGPLIGVEVPYLFFGKRPGQLAKPGQKGMEARVMRDFAGLENANRDTRSAMMDFSYHLTMGNMDEAFRSVRLIQSESVWENMARMCVSTRRLDVAMVCMGNMRNALGARALRSAANERDVEAKVAVLAIQLGMYDEAEALYKDCGRFDLLSKLYRDQGKWDQAIEVTRDKDRAHLRSTYYKLGEEQEAQGLKQKAIEAFERAEVHDAEVPRLLLEEPEALEAYVKRSGNKALLKWWAQYLESSHEMEHALQYYAAATDVLSQVRVHCHSGNIDKARELVEQTGDRSAAYHIARQYENQDNVKEAIHFFSQSKCYNNAIRLAKEHGLKKEMLSLALRSNKGDMVEAAEYYESQPGMVDKAVTLYHKGGRIAKALELCFQHSLFQSLADIAQDLDQDADPALLQRTADFFLDNKQYDKAVKLLVTGGQYNEAVDMCMQQNVTLTEEMAEKMTLPKSEDKSENEVRNQLLERVADCCAAQGAYPLATKKYTQAGNKVKAMRALLKCGDTEKIIYFAQKCRQKDIYIMAANYLQSLDWRNDQEILRNIVTFYTKGKALESLANFYDSCAQVEIDDYQNYEKALGAFNEALKCVSKAKMKDFTQQENMVSSLQHRIILVKKFLSIRQLRQKQPQEMLAQSRLLLEEPDIETAVRVGDIYAQIIEYLAQREEFQAAYDTMQELRSRLGAGADIGFYVNPKIVEHIHQVLDIPLGRGLGGVDQDDEVEEDIAN